MFLQIIISLWPLWLLLLVLLGAQLITDVLIPKLYSKRRFRETSHWYSDQETIRRLRSFSPHEFEEYIADLFSKLGFKTYVTGAPNDGGIDVEATKDGVTHYIQCKKYYAVHQVGVREVREFLGALASRLTNGTGYFVTTNIFTLEAKKLAENNPIELIDRYRLVEYIKIAHQKSDKKI